MLDYKPNKNWDFQDFWRSHYKLIPKEQYVEWALDFFGVKEFDECYWLDEVDVEFPHDDWYLAMTVDTMMCRWDFGDPLADLIFKVFQYLYSNYDVGTLLSLKAITTKKIS